MTKPSSSATLGFDAPFAESAKLEEAIKDNLKQVGYGF